MGREHPDVATSLNNLAHLYQAQGRYGEAEPLFVRSLAIYEQQLGRKHLDVAISLNNLAGLYKSQGRYGGAESLLVRSLEIKHKVLGESHPSTKLGWSNFRLFVQEVVDGGRAGELSEHPITQAVLEKLGSREQGVGE